MERMAFGKILNYISKLKVGSLLHSFDSENQEHLPIDHGREGIRANLMSVTLEFYLIYFPKTKHMSRKKKKKLSSLFAKRIQNIQKKADREYYGKKR